MTTDDSSLMCQELMSLILAWQDRGMSRGEIITVLLSTVAVLTPAAKRTDMVGAFSDLLIAAAARGA